MGGGKKPANIANPGNTPTAHASPSESSSAVVSAAAPPGLINVCHSVKVKVEVIMGKRWKWKQSQMWKKRESVSVLHLHPVAADSWYYCVSESAAKTSVIASPVAKQIKQIWFQNFYTEALCRHWEAWCWYLLIFTSLWPWCLSRSYSYSKSQSNAWRPANCSYKIPMVN